MRLSGVGCLDSLALVLIFLFKKAPQFVPADSPDRAIILHHEPRSTTDLGSLSVSDKPKRLQAVIEIVRCNRRASTGTTGRSFGALPDSAIRVS
jgi:hypothetical protein